MDTWSWMARGPSLQVRSRSKRDSVSKKRIDSCEEGVSRLPSGLHIHVTQAPTDTSTPSHTHTPIRYFKGIEKEKKRPVHHLKNGQVEERIKILA